MSSRGSYRAASGPVSPLHMVLKKDGTYCRLNAATVPDKYPVPNIQDMYSKLPRCSVFSKLDLKNSYYKISVAEEDVARPPLQRLSDFSSLLECLLDCIMHALACRPIV
jgi:hypothetical protein